MHVCMIVHKNYYTDPRVRRYAESLADAGVEVDVLCLKDLRSAPQMSHEKVKVFAIPLTCLVDRSMNYLLSYAIAFLWFSCWLILLHMKRRYSVIHVHNMPDFFVFAALLPRILGAKVILDIHDPMPEFYQSKFGRQADSLGAKFFRLQERLSAAFAHAVITANVYFKRNLVARGIPETKITVVNNVADPRWFDRSKYEQERRQTREHFTLIYPGTIAPRYGLDIAIRALPFLTAQIPHLRLRIIGPYSPHVDELISLAKNLGVFSFLEFTSQLPVEEIPRQIIRSDIGIYPALPDAHMNIATPTKVLEYAVMGIPVVASRLSILENLFGESAIRFFDAGDVEQFTSHVLDLYKNPDQCEELVHHADTVFVRTHTWNKERQYYFAVINRLLGVPEGSKERIVYPGI